MVALIAHPRQADRLMILRHPQLPVAVRIVRKPALADQELQHGSQWPHRFEHLSGISQEESGGGANDPPSAG